MKFKSIFTLLLSVAVLSASAQSQGYKDGIEYYKAGQYANAKTILDKTMNQPSTDKALAHYYLGQTELALGNKTEALNNFKAGIAVDPENGYNYVGLGALDLLNGNAAAAADQFKMAQKYAKKNYEVLVAIARAYYNADPVKYQKEYTKFLEKAHKDSKHTEPSIYILEGDILFDKHDFGSAAGKYEMAIGYDDANPEGYVKYANSYFHVNPKFAIDKLEQFLKKAPNSALAQRELAEKYFDGNYWKKAAELYAEYIKNPNHFPEDKARYSVLLYSADDFTNSLKIANEVLAEHPDNFLMQRLRFINEAALGDNEKAIADGEAFFAKNPSGRFTPNDFVVLAGAYSAVGNSEKAVEQYENGVKAFPDNADLLGALSSAYTADKSYLKAAEAYDKYLEALPNPSINDFFTASGRWLNAAATAGDNQEVRQLGSTKGLEYVNKALPEAPNNPNLYQRMARLYIAGNNSKPNDEAIAAYMKMLELLDADPAAKDPANPQNELGMYNEGYMFIIQYYNEVNPDEEKAKDYSNLLREIRSAMNPQ